jgi:hypothetical protein
MSNAELEVAEAVQRIIQSDVSQTKSILSSLPLDIRNNVVYSFRNNENLRFLFPEYVDAIAEAAAYPADEVQGRADVLLN